MEKKTYLEDDHGGHTTTVLIAQGTVGEIGIRGDKPFSEEGDLIVEYYNCSDSLSEALSSELCYTTLVARDNKADVVAAIRAAGNAADEADDDWLILRFLENNFDDYEPVRQWLRDKRIPFRTFYDSNYGVSETPADASDAQCLACLAHAGQTDKAGADYIEHPLRLAQTFTDEELKSDDYEGQKRSSDLRIIALLHDTLEDTWVTREFLERSGYEPHVIAAIEALTKLPDEEGSDEGYEKFIRRAGQNPLARLVKIADLKDNMDLSRFARPTDKDHARLAKYERALDYLQSFPAEADMPADDCGSA